MKERLEAAVRREQIAEAALTIVLDQGMGALTVRRVANLVGLTAPALYRHFKNKAEILSSVLDLVDDLNAENLRKAKAESSSPLDVLHGLFRLNIQFMQRYRALPIVYMSDLLWFEEPRLGERIRDECRRERAVVVEIIRQGQEAGQIRDDMLPDDLFNNYLGLYVMPGLMAVRQICEFDMDRQADVNWKLFEEAVNR